MPAETIYERVKADLAGCYMQGKKAAPKMNAGKLTLHAAIEKDGKVSCVIPTDDTGLTQEVEDCMSARLAKESFDQSGAPWTFELPLVVKADKLALGEDGAATASVLTVETHGLDESRATDVAEKLLPKFQTCVQNQDKSEAMRILHVGARVGSDGAVTCAIATSPTPLPPEASACAADALRAAKFPPPKKGIGLVSIPLKIMARKKK